MTIPRYVGNSFVARRLNVHHTTVISWRKSYPPDHQQVPTPAPAAFVAEPFGAEIPLWAMDQLPEWDSWHDTYRQYTQVNKQVRAGMARAAMKGNTR